MVTQAMKTFSNLLNEKHRNRNIFMYHISNVKLMNLLNLTYASLILRNYFCHLHSYHADNLYLKV